MKKLTFQFLLLLISLCVFVASTNGQGVFPIEFKGAALTEGEDNTVNIEQIARGGDDILGTTEVNILGNANDIDIHQEILNTYGLPLEHNILISVEGNENMLSFGIFPAEFKGAAFGEPSEVEWDFSGDKNNATIMQQGNAGMDIYGETIGNSNTIDILQRNDPLAPSLITSNVIQEGNFNHLEITQRTYPNFGNSLSLETDVSQIGNFNSTIISQIIR